LFNPQVIFMGSKPGSVVGLEYLIKKKWDILAVVVSKEIEYPWYEENNLRDHAKKLGIPVIIQSEIDPSIEVDYIISYMYRHMVKKHVRQLARYASINFHAAPLPEYGGWGTYNRAIIEESTYFGCTCHHMGDGFDDGPIVSIRKFPIDPFNITAFDLERMAQVEMIKLFVDVVNLIETNQKLPSVNQDRSKSNYLSFEEMESLKKIPDYATDEQIERLARAFWFPPHKGAFIENNGKHIEPTPALIKNLISREQGKLSYLQIQNIMNDYSKLY
jgi:methionyl-tRNA formyltransferase